ncbi:phage tail-collar fiber domain-containing protein [Providencia sp. M-8]|uniref:phage tail-collar fiber domain-containing protein n=1 Tax=Providencia sp. M-8 TaxID=2713151 RepID=UPI001F601CC8|nr:phage tail protein [Providencia sp. M-8]
MASVITVAFENWKAQEAASGKAVLLDEFVFANVPNLDPTQPIDRNEKLPPANQIVHRQAVNKAGLASENAVAYSVTLGAEVGNFDFNWIGLLNKASGTVAMITHAPLQKKLKTQNGQQGNVLTRSFILEFQGAAEETQIKTSAETWQIDFTARLSGIDEMQRLINVDSYGAAAFFNDGFEVTRSGEQYTVKKGLGYVGGLRGELAQNQILNGLRNTKVYADFSYQGNIVSQWNTVVKITSAAALNNYVDAAGFTHQVFAIASIDASGNVKDLRPMGALSSQEISALETRFKLDLSKKIDKANITSQTGNSTELVVNQHLLTTELGKMQPLGSYATTSDLDNGLASKFDKKGGNIIGQVTIGNRLTVDNSTIKINATDKWPGISIERQDANSLRIETPSDLNDRILDISLRDNKNNRINTVIIPKKSGTVMLGGDYGLGASELIQYTDNGTSITNKVGFYGISESDPNKIPGGGGGNFVQIGAGAYFWQLGKSNLGNAIYIRPTTNSVMGKWIKIWSESNTAIDRNGNLKVSTIDSELSDCQVGVPLPWPQSIAPSGYLVCNGQSFNKTTYPLLAKAYPAGVLPDLRGEFIRGLDAGRNIDSGRSVLSSQGDAMRALSGSVRLQGTESISQETGVFKNAGTFKDVHSGHGTGNANSKILGFDSSGVTPTANENRPRNIAFLYIVRAA